MGTESGVGAGGGLGAFRFSKGFREEVESVLDLSFFLWIAFGVEIIPFITTPLIISPLMTANFSEDADSRSRVSLSVSGSSSRPPGLVVMLEADVEEVKGKLVMTDSTEAGAGEELGTLTHRLRGVF